MNVFVLSTGRCGSTTFARACDHITNFSAAHESRIGTLRNRVMYPDGHIEVDNRLTWFLGRLEREYGDRAFYVHLKRDREATAESFTRRYGSGIIKAYNDQIVRNADADPSVSPIKVCRHYCTTVNTNVDLFLKDKESMEFWLESAEEDFREFWHRISAAGDLSMALREWSRKYNASNSGDAPDLQDVHDPDEVPDSEPSALPIRVAKKAARIVRKFPRFVKAA